ncbi:MAG: hypothetical protein IPP47_02640 [Bryobacterales bacterium]|nr:hypothetical protein [Bryobacterales bacterium]
MGNRFRRTLLTLAVAAASSLGQDSNLAGPVSGLLVDDQSRSIRPILGMPGSAYAGDASVTTFDFASAAPDGRSALIARAGALYLVRRLDGGTPTWRELSNESASFSRAAWSESSETLAVVNTSANRLEFWIALSNEPKLASTIDLTSFTGSVAALAVDKDARYAFAATQGADGSALYMLQAGGEPRMIADLGRSGGLLLSAGALYATDRGRNEVLRVTNWASAPEVATIASAGHGVNDPVGVALSADHGTLYIANAGINQLLGFDLAAGAVRTSLDLDFQPTRLERLGTGNLLLLERGVPGEAPAQVLDPVSLKVYFVPVSAASGE